MARSVAYRRTTVCFFTMVAFGAMSAKADLINLATGTNGSVNGALFYRADFQPAGTGVLDYFVRIRHDNGPSNNNQSPTGEEQGYNTSARPVQYDELTDPNFTRDLRFGEIPIVMVNGGIYKEFLLDINEPNGGGQNLLSLDQVKIYTSTTGCRTGPENTLGTLRYSLGSSLSQNVVTLDSSLSSGSGQGDMRMLVPLSNFAGVTNESFVYLYSYFGHFSASHRTGGGFEEWAVRVPAPGAVAVLAGGVLLVRRVRRLA